MGLYVAHNVCYAGFSLAAGWLADRLPKPHVLAAGYSLAALMAVLIIALPFNLWTLATVFVLGGIYVAIEETLEDSLCAGTRRRGSSRYGLRCPRYGKRRGRFSIERHCRPCFGP